MWDDNILQKALLGCFLAAIALVKIAVSEPNYRVIVEALENTDIKVEDPYVKFHYLRSAKFNDTTHVVNAAVTIMKDIPMDSMLELTAYEKKNNNDYSLIPVKLGKGKMCKFVKDDKLFFEDIVAVSNLARNCPFKAGNYTATNFVVRPNNMPDELPGERWRLDLLIQTVTKIDIWRLKIYIYINRHL